jgi:hypothetical protein
MSGVMKIIQPPGAAAAFESIGYDAAQVARIGVLELICTGLYLVPRTSVLGVILLTGYLGGAVAAHVRIHDAFLVPLALGVLVWAGPWLRDPGLRAWMPIRRKVAGSAGAS